VSIGVGDDAPDFDLAGTDHKRYALRDYLGQAVVLAFYPGDNTPVCTKQLNSYTDDIALFRDVGAAVLAISPQSVDSHEGFAAKQGGFAFPLLADTDKAVGEAYGIVGPLGFYRRSAFVIDPLGRIAYAHRAVAGLTYRPSAELVAAVRAASTP
jgi:thioredoxin-dependent peroxiredoxin